MAIHLRSGKEVEMIKEKKGQCSKSKAQEDEKESHEDKKKDHQKKNDETSIKISKRF